MPPMQPMTGYGGPPSYGGGPPSYGGPPSQGGGTYEFNEAENLTIDNVAKYARVWGIISLISGILVLLMGITVTILGGAIAAAMRGTSSPFGPAIIAAMGAALIPSSIVSIIGGVFYMKSGASLKAVTQTQGNDIALLTNAIRSLSTAFKIEAIAMAVGFVIGFILGIAMRAGGQS